MKVLTFFMSFITFSSCFDGKFDAINATQQNFHQMKTLKISEHEKGFNFNTFFKRFRNTDD